MNQKPTQDSLQDWPNEHDKALFQKIFKTARYQLAQEVFDEYARDLLGETGVQEAEVFVDFESLISQLREAKDLSDLFYYLQDLGEDQQGAAFLVVNAMELEPPVKENLKALLGLIPTKGWDT